MVVSPLLSTNNLPVYLLTYLRGLDVVHLLRGPVTTLYVFRDKVVDAESDVFRVDISE